MEKALNLTATQIDSLLARLADTPAHIARLAESHTSEQWRASDPSGWSAAEIFAHIRAADDILSHRLYAILVRAQPPMPVHDERRWAEVAGYAQATLKVSLQTFTLRRMELVNMLRRLPLADWAREGVHEERGALALLQLVTHIVEHEEEHCQQLAAR